MKKSAREKMLMLESLLDTIEGLENRKDCLPEEADALNAIRAIVESLLTPFHT
jgi:hypothetical protein